jgi:hypothetical protein
VHRWILAAALLLPGATALLLPGAAAAKEITAVTVCGAHACTRLTDRADLQAFMHASGMAEAAPSAPQRSYLVRVRISEPGAPHPDEWLSHWLPDAGVIVSADEGSGSQLFTAVDPPLARVLRRAAGSHAALRARRFVRRDPPARVDEVVEPPAAAAPAPPSASRAGADGGDGPPPSLAFVGVGALALLGAAGWRRARRG